MENQAFRTTEKAFYTYMEKHCHSKGPDEGMGDYFYDKEGNKIGHKFHGFAFSEYFLYGTPNDETTMFVNSLMNR